MRRPLLLLVASGAAIVGLVIVAVTFVSLNTQTVRVVASSESPCLTASDSSIRYTVFPPQSVCTFDDAGTSTSVVLASASPGAAGLGAVLALGGAAVCVGVLLGPRLRRS